MPPAVRVRYQSFGPEDTRHYRRELDEVVQAAGRACDAEVTVKGLPGSVLSRKQHRAFHLAGGADILDAAYQAAGEGCDAFVIGNIQDPALYECRQVCDIPVVGLLESALSSTRPFAASVALISTRSLTHSLLRERVATYGEQQRVHSIRTADLPIPTLERAFDEDDQAAACAAQFSDVASQAVADGAEAVIPASGLLATLLARVHGRSSGWDLGVGAPVVNPPWIAVAAAASAARLHGGGLTTSRAGTYVAPDAEVLAAYFADREQSRSTSAKDG